MIINVISTGSSGNLYELLDSKGNSIILEAGEPRLKFMQYREGETIPEMVIITHKHGDHAYYANEYEMICPVHRWQQKAESDNFKAFGFEVLHGDVLNYAYLIKFLEDDRFLFFATDLEYEEESLQPIFKALKFHKVENFLIECNYNDYLYHLAEKEQRIGCDRHFSDNDLIRFIKKVGAKEPKIITIHGSERLSGDSYTKKMIKGRIPNATVAVSVGAKNGVKNLFKL